MIYSGTHDKINTPITCGKITVMYILKRFIVIIEEEKRKRFCGLCEDRGQKHYY